MNKIQIFLQKNKSFAGTLMFAAFMLIQFVVLRLANQAGRGYLETEKQEYVYLFIQFVVIAGFLLYMMFIRLNRKHTDCGGAAAAVLGVSAFGAGIMLFAYEGSVFYLVITGLTVLCLGFMIGAVYLKLSGIIADGARAGACIGLGYSAAVALQYVFQLKWTVKPVLAILLIASFAVLIFMFLSKSETCSSDKQDNKLIPRSKLIFAAVITLAMMMFTTYYNSYIHHLQIASGYTDYNVYSWPRLLMIPTMLLFGFIGDIRKGRFLPIGVLCLVLLSLLNTVVLGRETYLLNMCLYYVSITAIILYYHLTFLRLAPRSKNPALWAAMGRLIDSVTVIIAFALKFSQLSTVTVLIIDIAILAVTVVLMAVNGDLNFTDPTEPVRIIETVSVPVSVPAPSVDPFPVIQEEYGISPGEMKVLKELVLTSDKQELIAERLNISISTLRHHVSSIYKKTGIKSRAALCQLAETKRQS